MKPLHELETQRRRMLAREALLVQEMNRLYARSDKILRTRLEALTKELKGLAREDALWGFFQREKVQHLLDQIEVEIARSAPAMARAVTNAQSRSARAGLQDVAWIGRARVVTGWVRLPQGELTALTGFMSDGTPLADRFLREGADAVSRAREVMFQGILEGKGSAVIGRRLHTAVRTITRGNAVLIARTESHRAYRRATIASYASNSRVTRGWRWLAAKDGRTCPICLALDGTEHPLTEEFGSHPACRCVPVPVLLGRDLNYGPTGQEWFAVQPESTQRKILGASRHRLYRDGKIALPDLVRRVPSVWGPTAGAKSLRQLMDEGVVTAEDVLGARKRAA